MHDWFVILAANAERHQWFAHKDRKQAAKLKRHLVDGLPDRNARAYLFFLRKALERKTEFLR